MTERFDFVLSRAEPLYDNGDPGHDFSHIRRVCGIAAKLARAEGADLEVTLCGAVLHDVVNLPKNHPERLEASRMAAEKAERILTEAGYSEDERRRIADVITEHSYSLGKRPSSPESAVLQDADKLDALGAIGILRMASCGTRMGSSYYEPTEPFAKTRPLNDKAFLLDHFFTKLLKLPELMNTKAGKLEAERRAGFMREFLSRLESEIAGA